MAAGRLLTRVVMGGAAHAAEPGTFAAAIPHDVCVSRVGWVLLRVGPESSDP
ncbi:hypothetical protein GCM10010326_53960 [Streptomyces xanthochromogenes]|uniref:Uncharacterized protein n=1 Tax=Streptomyces xanthochromogenes TaxID=67384 RepID=A0ABQ3AH29_9ACTN|nr:hypothetical protein GCM10010326_53960 [Streptomyces xanthochromogenes]